MLHLEKEIAKLEASCELLQVSQKIKELVIYLLKNREALKCSIHVYLKDAKSFQPTTSPRIFVQLPGCVVGFARKSATVVIGEPWDWEQYPFSFKPKSVEHFFEVLNVLKRLPKGLDLDTQKYAVALVEKHKEVSIEELLVLLKLKDA